MFNLMCGDLNAARLNKERQKRGIGNRLYEEQSNAIAQWRWGETKPSSIIMGELPVINLKQIRFDRDTDLELY